MSRLQQSRKWILLVSYRMMVGHRVMISLGVMIVNGMMISLGVMIITRMMISSYHVRDHRNTTGSRLLSCGRVSSTDGQYCVYERIRNLKHKIHAFLQQHRQKLGTN